MLLLLLSQFEVQAIASPLLRLNVLLLLKFEIQTLSSQLLSLSVIVVVVEVWGKDLRLSPGGYSHLVSISCDVIVVGDIYRGI